MWYLLDLLLCGQDMLDSLRAHTLDPESIRPKLSTGREWRRLYTDASLMRALDITTGRNREDYDTKITPGPGPKGEFSLAGSHIPFYVMIAGELNIQ